MQMRKPNHGLRSDSDRAIHCFHRPLLGDWAGVKVETKAEGNREA